MKKITIILALILPITFTYSQNIESSANDVCPIKLGQTVPQAELFTVDSKSTNLVEVMNGQSAILIFYRGSWCPYCNRQLAALKKIEPDLLELGFKIIAISPDKPEKLQVTLDENELSYTLLSDHKIDLTSKMGLAFVDHKNRTLPVPAVYLLDSMGVVQHSYVNPNYKVRMQPELILTAAKLLSSK